MPDRIDIDALCRSASHSPGSTRPAGEAMTSAPEQRTQFDYLLNAVLDAGRHKNPAEHDYYGKTQKMFAYVRDLEAKAAQSSSLLVMAAKALEGVIRVADRATVEFDTARAALSAINEHLNAAAIRLQAGREME